MDAAKERTNARKHGVTFDEASTVFGDPLSLLMPDPDYSEGGERYLLLGMSTQQRLLVVAFSGAAAANQASLSQAGGPTRAEAI